MVGVATALLPVTSYGAPPMSQPAPEPGSPAYVARDVQNINDAYGRITGPGGQLQNPAYLPALVAAGLEAANREILEAIRRMDDARLDDLIGDTRDPVLGSGVTCYVALHGAVQHHVYHAGQISLLKRAHMASE